MTIVRPIDGKKLNVKNLKELLHEDKKYVEFTIIGNNKEWVEAILYNDFIKANPTINIKEI